MSKFTVVVAGAGLGGLASAHGLHRRSIDVVVYERDSAVDTRRQGYRLHLDAAARRALHQVLTASLCALFAATTGTSKRCWVMPCTL
ncbi:NAD(P)-binding protein [Nocardia elegans]|uniref:FAD-dependent oxidoreductase n=1 Tax=Nocardia elegans TaxID=300029 RepID=A0ABW6TA54_9NOCA|nr:NAD(P)-binding protein [Nocardia elegans]MBF6448521.1 NAD(P)-binding protein [Nocardia elegans]